MWLLATQKSLINQGVCELRKRQVKAVCLKQGLRREDVDISWASQGFSVVAVDGTWLMSWFVMAPLQQKLLGGE